MARSTPASAGVMFELSEFGSACGVRPAVAGVATVAFLDSLTILLLGCLVSAETNAHPKIPCRGTTVGIVVS